MSIKSINRIFHPGGTDMPAVIVFSLRKMNKSRLKVLTKTERKDMLRFMKGCEKDLKRFNESILKFSKKKKKHGRS